MMVTQAFLFNAIFFTYALVLKVFYSRAGGQPRRTTSSRSPSAT